MTQMIRETAGLTAVPVTDKPGRLLVTLITPGQGSSGYYSSEVLEAAATDKVFPAGTQMYLDHPTESEQFERPERSVKDLGAVLVEDAYAKDGALVAEAEAFSQHRELLSEMQQYIGVSVRASADVSEGPRRTIERLIASPSNSVDFVTRAGRGGSFTVLESARPSAVNRRALRHDSVREATVNDQREALDDVLKNTHGADNVYVWLRDFDATTAWFEISADGGETTYSQAYTTGDNGLADAMTGERTEVRQVTQYVPVTPVGQSTTQESAGGHMATTTIEESALSELREAAGRVTALESERDTAIARADKAEAEVTELKESAAVRTRKDKAAEIVAAEAKAAEIGLTPLEIRGLTADLPVKESELNVEAFTKTVQEALTEAAKDTGRPRGFGATTSTPPGSVSEADFDDAFKTKEV